IQENIAGMKIIRAFVRRDHEINRFANTNAQLQKETRYAFRFVESSMPVLLSAMNISLIFILWFGHIRNTILFFPLQYPLLFVITSIQFYLMNQLFAI